jgi:hypothetical protein
MNAQNSVVMGLNRAVCCGVLLLGVTWMLCAQQPFSVAEHYTKFEFRIPMRDGVRLFTAVYTPKDGAKRYPFLIQRTPYSVAPYGVDKLRSSLGPDEQFARDGYIFVYQDVRGRFQSEGAWVEMTPHRPVKQSNQDVDESTDTYDTIEWLLRNVPHNNGKAGLYGISYPGFYAAAGMIDAHPALKAVSPQAPVTDLFLGDDCFHNGAFMLAANFTFYSFFVERKEGPQPPQPRAPVDRGTPDGYDFFLAMGPLANANEKYLKFENPYWNALMAHTRYDEFWQSRAIQRHLKKVAPAVMTVGGWFDAEDPVGPLLVYRETEKNNPGITNFLVMGPWSHGGWARGDGDRLGQLDFHVKTGKWYREKLQAPFFKHFLKGEGDGKFAEAYVFETGTNRWREYAAWPPLEVRKRPLYLADEGKLSWQASSTVPAFDEYLADPNKPVPYVGHTTFGMEGAYMTEDQRFAARRPDVLTYQTEVLEEDLTVAGPLELELHVSTTGTDADFVVKVIDVFPPDYPARELPKAEGPAQTELQRQAARNPRGGYQMLVRGEPFRGKYRKSMEEPEPFTPGKVEAIRFALPDMAHTFRRGHRVMVQIQSSWFPLVDRNPQTFGDIPNMKPEEFRKATHRVYRGGATATNITLPVVGTLSADGERPIP